MAVLSFNAQLVLESYPGFFFVYNGKKNSYDKVYLQSFMLEFIQTW